MGISKIQLLLLFTLIILQATLMACVHISNERKPYIVYMGDLPAEAGISLVDQHHNLLAKAIGDESIARESKIYSYGRSFNGFVARLLPHEVAKLSEEENVVSVFANTKNKLHTTRSWDFLGMTPNVQRSLQLESNIIVGVLDTGIYVNAPSFKDDGYGPAPARWKGKCITGTNFTGCNKKVIGAKYYDIDGMNTRDKSPADDDGHGTHTSSTVAGVSVSSASLYGIGNGTARGGVPSARIAMYKVCWEDGCTDMDLLAGFDDAIADGVDLISISIGGWPKDYFDDPIAIGSFHAAKHGILTSSSAGNDGPLLGSVSNVAPWMLTVGASSIDRQFKTALKLGNGMKTTGISISTFSPEKAMYSLTSGLLAKNISNSDYFNISACDRGSLDINKVKGKIVFCLGNGPQDSTLKELNGAGVILSITTMEDIAFTSLIASTNVNIKDGLKIGHYINSTKNPEAVIYKTRAVTVTAPAIASFSSRGPQAVSLNILKPDLVAPGLDILAGYSELATITGDTADNRYSKFNFLSGTSMACPHAAAAAAYIKSFHPDWTPAMIKSALMTTATPIKIKDKSMELGSGSGQINPRKAIHPGLVYDISMSNYISFLCKEGYNGTLIGLLFGDKKKYNCANFKTAQGTDGLNYPSMHLQLENPNSNISAVYYRTVTHVGYGPSVYKATVKCPENFSVKVIPETLTFKTRHEKLDFKVIVEGKQMANGKGIQSALLEWNDHKHSVKSPIVLFRILSI
ncbi:subtilisin-like protease SBT4.15 [Mercurialis annua]|uniref:subtilisin-like protease SBT4.15 n=1 Tax=Mercurialis annua TaxID=3986 RepID=UPI00215E682F|nr:subtilisin-like protease SBT4.15 [Mercurialis annua]